MSFLQPYILWGLPLIFLPVLIHLFNRLRHRSVPWAAMMFLRSATRKSTRYARLRQFLILLFRVLAVLGLVLAISRPLAGGWAGWMFASTPDVILVLLDRSASMETRQTENSKRADALKLIAQSAAKLEGTSRLVLMDSASRLPQEIPNAAVLPEISLAAPTDTAADMPAMMQSALDWLQKSKPGSAELWIVSDLQASNWHPESDHWPALASGIRNLPQGVRVRLLALNSEPQGNVSAAAVEAIRHQTAERSELEVVIDLQRNTTGPLSLPLTVNLDGAPSQVDIKMDGPALRYRHKVALPNAMSTGWGYIDLPADANPRDNRSYFVYGPPPKLRALVVSADPQVGRVLQAATAPNPKETNTVCELLNPNALGNPIWDDYALVLWQAPLPNPEVARRLRAYAEAGGAVVFFPPGQAGQFDGSGWGEVQEAITNKPFAINRWEEKEGPLAKTGEGWSLPLADLLVQKRQPIQGERIWLATFEDGTPFLTRRNVGKGQYFFCATLPARQWSELSDGAVLVPMVQRLLETGGRRFAMGSSVSCGDWSPEANNVWTAVGGGAGKSSMTDAGVYRTGGQLVAVNRPAREDNNDMVDIAQARALFGQLPVHTFEDKQGIAAALQSELWRLFLFLMLVFLVVEGFLILPERTRKSAAAVPVNMPAPKAEQPAEANV